MFSSNVSTAANASIAIGGCQPGDAANPTHASTSMQGGKAVFENDNYRIVASDANRVEISNKQTGEHYEVWGDPHVNVDGKHAFDFWGTTTFQLNDGTKLTFQTVPAGNGMTLPSTLTITNGEYGSRITGIDTVKNGDLHVDEGKSWGNVIDGVVDDGNVLYENANGKGFVALDDSGKLRQVDQQFINATDLQKGGAGRAQAQQQQQMAQLYQSAFQMMSGLLSISMTGLLLRNLGEDGGRSGSNGGRAWPGGTPWFNEAGNGNQWNLSAHLDISLSLTLTRWNG
jgi:hypothetical protein